MLICEILEFTFDCRVDKRLDLAFQKYEALFGKAFALDLATNSLLNAPTEGSASTEGSPTGSGTGTEVALANGHSSGDALRKIASSPKIVTEGTLPPAALQSPGQMSKACAERVEQYAKQPELWDKHAPWSLAQLDEIYADLFGASIISSKVAESKDPMQPSNFILDLLSLVQIQYLPLQARAFSLLSRQFGQRVVFAKLLSQMQVLVVPEVGTLYYTLKGDVSELRRHKKWLLSTKDPEKKAEAYKACHGIFQLFDDLCSISDVPVSGVEGMKLCIGPEEVPKFQELLRNVSAFDYTLDILNEQLKQHASSSTPRTPVSNTNLLTMPSMSGLATGEMPLPRAECFSIGLLDCGGGRQAGQIQTPEENLNATQQEQVLQGQGMFQREDSFMFADFETPELPRLFAKAYQFLRKAVVCNKKNQEYFFTRQEVFRRHVRVGGLGAELFMMEIIRDNRAILDKIEDVLFKEIFALLAQPEKRSAELLQLLQCCIVYDGKRHGENTTSCQRYVTLHQGALEFFPGEAGRLRCHKLISEAGASTVMTGELDFYLHSVRLLTYMCKGRSSSAEVFASTLLEFDETLARIIDLGTNALEAVEDTSVVYAIKGELMMFLWEVYIDTEVEALLEALLVPHNRVWSRPVGKGQENKATLMEEVEKALVMAAQSGASKPLHQYTFGAVVPAMHAYYSNHSRAIEHLGQTNTSVATMQGRIYAAGLKLYQSPTAATAAEQQLLYEFLVELKPDTPQLQVEEVVVPMDLVKERRALFKSGFRHFFLQLAPRVGITDLKRFLGLGAQHFARMLVTEESTSEHGVINMRAVSYELFRVLMRWKEAELTPDLTASLLRVVRSYMYLEVPGPAQAPDEAVELNWALFVNNLPPQKSEPAIENLQWVQLKYAMLGVPDPDSGCRGGVDVVCALTAHPNVVVQLAAIRYGITLLSTGNALVQNHLLDGVVQGRGEFMRALHKMIMASESACKDLVHMTKATKENPGETVDEEAEEAAQKIGIATEAMLLLQQLCEGHNGRAQAFMREQKPEGAGSFVSIDIVGEVVGVLDTVSRKPLADAMTLSIPEIVELVIQACDLLTEITQGPNFDSQLKLTVSTDVVTIIDLMLKEPILEPCHKLADGVESPDRLVMKAGLMGEADVTRAHYKCLMKQVLFELMIALLEGSNNTQEIPDAILNSLDPTNLVNTIFSIHGHSGKDLDDLSHEDHFGQGALADVEDDEELVDLYQSVARKALFVLKYCLDCYSHDPADKAPFQLAMERLTVERDALTVVQGCDDPEHDLTRSVASVEVNRDVKSLTAMHTIYFEVPTECRNAAQMGAFVQQADARFQDIDRDNPDGKAAQIMHVAKSLTIEMDHINRVAVNPVLQFFLQNQGLIINAPLISAFTCLALLLLFYGRKEGSIIDGDPTRTGKPFGDVDYACFVLFEFVNFFHVICVIVLVTSYILIKAPITVRLIEYQDAVERKMQNRGSEGDEGFVYDPSLFPYEQILPPIPSLESPPTLTQRIITLLFRTVDPLYYMSYCTVTFFMVLPEDYGGSPFFVTFVLLDYFRTEGGQLVLSSIKVGGPGLVKSSVVGVILVLIFGSISWLGFQDEINQVNECNTAYQCFLFILDKGLQGGLGEFYGDDHGNFGEEPYVLFFWDNGKAQGMMFLALFFYIVWAYILEGIVTGQIIDAFSEIRSQAEERKKDSQDKCLICSLDRFVLDHDGYGFKRHQNVEHNPWNYFFFIRYISRKDPTLYSGMETYVAEMLREDDHGFMPVEACCALQDPLHFSKITPFEQDIKDRLMETENKIERLARDVAAVPAMFETILQRALHSSGINLNVETYERLKSEGDEGLARALAGQGSSGGIFGQ